MKKSLFQILDEMNLGDEKNNTTNVGVCNGLISAQMTKKGTQVIMGAPTEAIKGIMSGEIIPILLLINRNEYNKLSNN